MQGERLSATIAHDNTMAGMAAQRVGIAKERMAKEGGGKNGAMTEYQSKSLADKEIDHQNEAAIEQYKAKMANYAKLKIVDPQMPEPVFPKLIPYGGETGSAPATPAPASAPVTPPGAEPVYPGSIGAMKIGQTYYGYQNGKKTLFKTEDGKTLVPVE